jgi:hypothetical protein
VLINSSRYDSQYCPAVAFQLEVQWLVATGCLVNQMVDRWMNRAESRGFRLVPVPIANDAEGAPGPAHRRRRSASPPSPRWEPPLVPPVQPVQHAGLAADPFRSPTLVRLPTAFAPVRPSSVSHVRSGELRTATESAMVALQQQLLKKFDFVAQNSDQTT